MIVGFIGFGEVSSTISNILSRNGVQTVTVVKGRSEKTNIRAIKSDVQIIDSYDALVKGSDVVISANSPANALNVAKKVSKLMDDGIYIDLNNVSPDTTLEMSQLFEKPQETLPKIEEKHSFFKKQEDVDMRNMFVDGAIIGKVSNDPTTILFSGQRSGDLAILNNYGLNIMIVSNKPGDVSTLKTLRSLYTKGVSAVLMEAYEASKEIGMVDQLFEILSLTEGETFEEKSKSRIRNSYINSKRKVEEMDEALEFLDKISPKGKKNFMTKAARDKFNDVK